MLSEVLSYSFNQKALLAGILIGFLNGFMGGHVILRRSALFAGALSHTLFPGIAIGALIAGINPFSTFIGACGTALLIGLLSQGIARYSRIDKNSALAVLYTAAFGAGLLILNHLDTYVSLKEYLFGNILGISNFDLWFCLIVSLITLSFFFLWQRPILVFTLSKQMATAQGIKTNRLEILLTLFLILTMVSSIHAVGTILTLGLLVGPASILYLFLNSPSQIMIGGGILGSLVSTFSIFLANIFDVQTGAIIVILLGIIFILSFLLSPRYGLISKRSHRFIHH